MEYACYLRETTNTGAIMQHDDTNEATNGNGDLRMNVVRWLLGQEASTVLLFLILGAIAWFAKYCLDVAVPAHLRMIQSGYEQVATRHSAEVRELRETFEKASERHERLLREIAAANAD